MDALSSQSNVAGYKAALIAAEELDRFFPMLMTAAGTIRPATVLVLGVGRRGTAGDRHRQAARGGGASVRCPPRGRRAGRSLGATG